MTTSQLKLLDLPVEILSEILTQLDHIHILRCSAVSASSFLSHNFVNTNPTLTFYSWNKGLQQTPRPRYHFPRSPVPHSTRLGWAG